MRNFTITTVIALILTTWNSPQIQATCTAASTCSTYTANPSGGWSLTCKSCSSWSSANSTSTFKCPSDGGTCSYTDSDTYTGCLNADQDSCRSSNVDISNCPACSLGNSDGYLVCETQLIYVDATVVISGDGSKSNPYSATWSYSIDTTNSTPNPAAAHLMYSQAAAISGPNSSPFKVKVRNGRAADIYYDFDFQDASGNSVTGWALDSTPASPTIGSWASWLSSCKVDSDTAKLVDDGSTSNTNQNFKFKIKNGSTTLTSPDPTVVTKADPNT